MPHCKVAMYWQDSKHTPRLYILPLAGGNDSIGVRLCTALFKRAYGDFTQSVFTDSLPNVYSFQKKSKIAYGF